MRARRLGFVLYLCVMAVVLLLLVAMAVSLFSGVRVTVSALTFGLPALLLWLATRAVCWIRRAPY